MPLLLFQNALYSILFRKHSTAHDLAEQLLLKYFDTLTRVCLQNQDPPSKCNLDNLWIYSIITFRQLPNSIHLLAESRHQIDEALSSHETLPQEYPCGQRLVEILKYICLSFDLLSSGLLLSALRFLPGARDSLPRTPLRQTPI